MKRKINLDLFSFHKQKGCNHTITAFCFLCPIVPRAGVEPARVAPLVFETSASTDSAIWAFAGAKIRQFSESAKFLAFFLFLCLNHLPEACCYDGTNERTYNEDPYISQSLATSKEGWTNGTSGIHTGTGEVDTYQMDEN